MTTTASFSRACWADVSGKLVFIRNHVECGFDFSATHVGPMLGVVRVFTMFLKNDAETWQCLNKHENLLAKRKLI